MINYIWFGLMVISVIVGAFTGNLKAVTNAAVESAGTAVEIAIGLIGIMALWLGIMNIAKKSGLIKMLSRAIRPVSRLLFPNIPEGHSAIGSMLMNVSANWLGLGNAATPLGLKAMKELQELNPSDDTATNAMVTFLAINTASITFIPMTIIGIRTELGAANPFEIISTSIFASTCACVTAVFAAKMLQKVPAIKKSDPELAISEKEEEDD